MTTAPRWHELTAARRAALEYVRDAKYWRTEDELRKAGHWLTCYWLLEHGLIKQGMFGYTITASGKASLSQTAARCGG